MVRELTLRRAGASVSTTLPADMAERLHLGVDARVPAVDADQGILLTPHDADVEAGLGVAGTHTLDDGNKRLAFLTMGILLGRSGKDLDALETEVVQATGALAAGSLWEPQSADWVRRRLTRLAPYPTSDLPTTACAVAIPMDGGGGAFASDP